MESKHLDADQIIKVIDKIENSQEDTSIISTMNEDLETQRAP